MHSLGKGSKFSTLACLKGEERLTYPQKNITKLDNKIKDTNKNVLENQMFKMIKDILSSNPRNHETQLKIESLVFNGFKNYFADTENVVKVLGGFHGDLLTNKKFVSFIHSTIGNIQQLLTGFERNLKSHKSRSKVVQEYNKLFEYILSTLNKKDLISVIITSFFNILTYNLIIQEDNQGELYS